MSRWQHSGTYIGEAAAPGGEKSYHCIGLGHNLPYATPSPQQQAWAYPTHLCLISTVPSRAAVHRPAWDLKAAQHSPALPVSKP